MISIAIACTILPPHHHLPYQDSDPSPREYHSGYPQMIPATIEHSNLHILLRPMTVNVSIWVIQCGNFKRLTHMHYCCRNGIFGVHCNQSLDGL
jgi:hypothetical protein